MRSAAKAHDVKSGETVLPNLAGTTADERPTGRSRAALAGQQRVSCQLNVT